LNYSNTVIYLVPNGLTQRAGFIYPFTSASQTMLASLHVTCNYTTPNAAV
jgi:hypothetical protein